MDPYDPISLIPPFTLNPKKTALMLVDMQNCFLSRDHSWFNKLLIEKNPTEAKDHFIRVDEVINNTKRLLQAFRERNMDIVYITAGCFFPDMKDYLPIRREGTEYLRSKGIMGTEIPVIGSKEHEIHEQLTPLKNEIVLNKSSKSAFTSTGVDQVLRNIGIEYLVITGWASIVCVNATAIAAADLGYKVILVGDACQCRRMESHKAFLKIFSDNFGKVLSTKDVLKEVSQ